MVEKQLEQRIDELIEITKQKIERKFNPVHYAPGGAGSYHQVGAYEGGWVLVGWELNPDGERVAEIPTSEALAASRELMDVYKDPRISRESRRRVYPFLDVIGDGPTPHRISGVDTQLYGLEPRTELPPRVVEFRILEDEVSISIISAKEELQKMYANPESELDKKTAGLTLVNVAKNVLRGYTFIGSLLQNIRINVHGDVDLAKRELVYLYHNSEVKAVRVHAGESLGYNKFRIWLHELKR